MLPHVLQRRMLLRGHVHPAGDRHNLPCHRLFNDDVLSLLQTKGNTDYTLLRIGLHLFQNEFSFSVMIYTCFINEKMCANIILDP